MFRAVGRRELELVRSSGWRRWPPRYPEQPIFYPVTNERYAAEMASKWNVDEEGVGYVTRFHVRTSFVDQFEIHCVGAAHHTEWWIPRERVEELNANVIGTIELVAKFEREGPEPLAATTAAR